MKESTKAHSHEGGQTDGQTESRGKTASRSRPTRSKREKLVDANNVETDVSTSISTSSISPRLAQVEPVERPGVLNPRQIEAIRYDYETLGLDVDQISKVTGASRSTVYKHVEGLTRHIASTEPESVSSTTPGSDPPPNRTVTAVPPKIVEVVAEQKSKPPEEAQDRLNGDEYRTGYSGSYQAERFRPPLPVTDSETISQLLLVLGRDMRRRGFSNFPDFFEYYLIPQLERLEFWTANIPGGTPEEKDQTFRRYLWIVTRFFSVQKEYSDYAAANNGVKAEDS